MHNLSLLIFLTPKIFVRTRQRRGVAAKGGEPLPRKQCGGARGKYVYVENVFPAAGCARRRAHALSSARHAKARRRKETKTMENEDLKGEGFQTRAIHAGKSENRTHAVTPPIWQTTTFSADSSEHFADIATAVRPAEFYTRYGNPTHKEVEATLVAREGGEAALLTSSGMGSIFTALISVLKTGDHVVAQTNHYAGAMTLLDEMPRRFGVEVTLVDQTRAGAFADRK